MYGWLPTQQAQERLRKLSYKSQLAGAKQAILQSSLRQRVEALSQPLILV